MANDNFNKWLVKFRMTGNIDPVALGMVRHQLVTLFGEPDDLSVEAKKGRLPTIIKYGELEFHFGLEEESPLSLIYQDTDEGIVLTCIKRIC